MGTIHLIGTIIIIVSLFVFTKKAYIHLPVTQSIWSLKKSLRTSIFPVAFLNMVVLLFLFQRRAPCRGAEPWVMWLEAGWPSSVFLLYKKGRDVRFDEGVCLGGTWKRGEGYIFS